MGRTPRLIFMGPCPKPHEGVTPSTRLAKASAFAEQKEKAFSKIRESLIFIFFAKTKVFAYEVKGIMPLQGYWGQRPQGLI